jgi:transcriptional antiterminator RfaH
MNWYVVYTKPKWEKKVAERLNEIGVVTYCPLVTKTRQWSDRKKIISVPLFNSYIFVQVEDKERNRVFEITGAIRYSDTYEVSLDQWKKGDKIILESGPFISQPAIIQEVKQNHYILILESLGCLLRVDKVAKKEI